MRVKLGARELVELGSGKCPRGKAPRKGHMRRIRPGVRVRVASACVSKGGR
jgi:hypothetical protein